MKNIVTNELKVVKLHAVQELGHIVSGAAQARCMPFNDFTERANLCVSHQMQLFHVGSPDSKVILGS